MDRLRAACRVLLVGMMGSGKTTVGRALAAETGWPYFDNDELVAQVTGVTARQLLAQQGESAMRLAESDALVAALAVQPPAICGIAAGIVISHANRQALIDGGIVVWLTADPWVLASRAVGSEHRPWLEEEAEAWLREVARERAPLYAQVASLTVNSDDLGPQEVLDVILAHLSDMARCAQWLPADAGREAAGEGVLRSRDHRARLAYVTHDQHLDHGASFDAQLSHAFVGRRVQQRTVSGTRPNVAAHLVGTGREVGAQQFELAQVRAVLIRPDDDAVGVLELDERHRALDVHAGDGCCGALPNDQPAGRRRRR
ncbi:hypothetical protein BH23CHL7_BH23CHL7_04180 [soil metagenome]